MVHRDAYFKLSLLAIGLAVLTASGCGDDDPTEPTVETGKLLYVANSGDSTISVIDTQTNAVTQTLTQPTAIRTLRLHPLRNSFYAVQASANRVTKILQRDITEIGAIQLPGQNPQDLAFSLDASIAYVSMQGSNQVAFLRLAEDRVLTTINVGQGPTDIAVDPTSLGRLWVVNETGRNISVIDLANNTVTKTITAVTQPRNIVFRGALAYVSDAARNVVQPIRLDNLETDPNAPALASGRQPAGMAIAASSTNLLIANTGDNNVLIIDLTTPTTRTVVPTGAGPTEIVINSDLTRAYVANTAGNSITVIDLNTKQAITNVPVGAAPRSMTFF